MNLLDFFQELIETGEVSIEGYDGLFYWTDGQLYQSIDGRDYLVMADDFANMFNIPYLYDLDVPADDELN
jgi:hypothetical protein